MWVIIALLSVFFVGCSMARGVNELLPGAQFSKPVASNPSQVRVFKNGAMPKSPCIMVANIAAHGNGYATMETLEQTLLEEAATLRADTVIVLKHEITKDETVGAYGGGIMMADSIQRPHLYGVACRTAKVGLGININRTKDSDQFGVVLYVPANSPAARIGMTEGDKLLAVNGITIFEDELVIEREISSKQPGERATVEFLTKNNVKVSKEIILEEVDAWTRKDDRVKPGATKPSEP